LRAVVVVVVVVAVVVVAAAAAVNELFYTVNAQNILGFIRDIGLCHLL